jgi:hypothetical protein
MPSLLIEKINGEYFLDLIDGPGRIRLAQFSSLRSSVLFIALVEKGIKEVKAQ